MLISILTAGRTGARILVVDDEPDLRNSIRELLEAFIPNSQIAVAASGILALEHIKTKPVDLIVTDYKMPGMNGIQFIAEAQKVLPGVRRILITAFDRELLAQLGDKSDEIVLHKPFDPVLLLSTVEGCLAQV